MAADQALAFDLELLVVQVRRDRQDRLHTRGETFLKFGELLGELVMTRGAEPGPMVPSRVEQLFLDQRPMFEMFLELDRVTYRRWGYFGATTNPLYLTALLDEYFKIQGHEVALVDVAVLVWRFFV